MGRSVDGHRACFLSAKPNLDSKVFHKCNWLCSVSERDKKRSLMGFTWSFDKKSKYKRMNGRGLWYLRTVFKSILQAASQIEGENQFDGNSLQISSEKWRKRKIPPKMAEGGKFWQNSIITTLIKAQGECQPSPPFSQPNIDLFSVSISYQSSPTYRHCCFPLPSATFY